MSLSTVSLFKKKCSFTLLFKSAAAEVGVEIAGVEAAGAGVEAAGAEAAGAAFPTARYLSSTPV